MPTLLHRLVSMMRWVARRSRAEQDLNDELQSYLDMAAADEVRDGATPSEARRRAALQLGGIEQTKERVRNGRHGAWLDVLAQDISYGWRQVRPNRSFSALAIATLALGIGGITAMFSVFDAVLIRPLPYADADRLVMLWLDMGKPDSAGVKPRHDPTPWEWVEWRRLNTVFTDLACTQSGDITISGDGEPEKVPSRKATWNFWSVLGVQPQLGRAFTEDEDNKKVKVVMISHGLWQRRFGGAADIVGRKISLNDEAHEVVGVLPRNFYFMPTREIDLWLPASFPDFMLKSTSWHDAHIIGRLKPDVTLEHAARSMHALSLQVTAKDFRGPHSVHLVPLRQDIAGRTRTALVLLLGASAVLLLIACVNLTNLLLSRGAARGREVAVRAALGASRGRLVVQFLTESLVLAGLGTLAGFVIALPAMRFLERLVPEQMGAAHLTLDWRMLAFSAAVAIAATLTFGLAPALRGSRRAPREAMSEGGRGSTGARSHWFQHSLIVAETALAVVLLTCGGLLLQTFQHLRHTDLGMKKEQLLTFETPLFRYKEFDRRAAFINAEVEKVRALPGVISAGFINWIPLTNTANATFYRFEGQAMEDTTKQVALMRNVSTGYFETIGAQLREGRHFDASDRKSSLHVAIVNEAFANRHFGSASPLGKRFRYGRLGDNGYWYTIVGVVKQIRESSVLEEMRPTVYRVHEQCDQTGDLGGGIAVRTAAEPASIVPAIRAAIWSLDKNQPLARIRMMDEIIEHELSTSTQSTALMTAFALLALVLASLGIYGVLSYAVTQRTNEIGVRMALGASSRGVMLSIGGRGLALTLAGLAIGLVLASLASRSMTTLLYGFNPAYLPIAAVVSLILVAIAALASFLPALRASRIDPMIALRQE